ncbi:MAG: glycosyltransferase [Oscillospiraceae bacterium]|nr:glycosyltransferase [Oscillospiraceae bacterium]
MGIKRLVERSVYTLKNEGAKMFVLKTKTYLANRKARNEAAKQPMLKKIFADVLFINGCYLPHPSRYRVSHQKEQLFANGMVSEEVFYTELDLSLVKRFRAFVFFRCPCTETVEAFIKAAKAENKLVLFDIDDLVIDTKYTDTIPYLKKLTKEEKKQYDYGVNAMRKTLQMCDGAVTTTEALAEELKKYTPQVFINRNTASDTMCSLSKQAVYKRDMLPLIPDDELNKKELSIKRKITEKAVSEKGFVKIGYFSGSITHNDDIELILPVLTKVMGKHSNVHLYFVGELDIPSQLQEFKDRIHSMPFVDWKELPELISGVDINIAPLCDTVFNAAKSENKWVEAALVKVPTAASRVGAMEHMISDGETGILCGSSEEWLAALDRLVTDEAYRKKLALNAFNYVTAHCLTINTGVALSEYIRSKMTKNIAFVLPSLAISGGVLVILKHCAMLKSAGYDVLIINDNDGNENIVKDNVEINVLSTRTDSFHGRLDIAVGSLWTTMDWIRGYGNISQKAYLVQNYETGFYDYGEFFRFRANQTYMLSDVKYITISKWCQKWLTEDFHQKVSFIPNGLECSMFGSTERKFDRKRIRILVEGNSDDYYKNVDESFRIIERLDKDKYEIWFLSYQGKPKEWYHVDKFMHRVPYEKVAEIYRECDILLKTSILESFSYPPLEMMATGGFVVVRPNDGNVEYLRDGENCLFYDGEDLDSAVKAIERISSDSQLREKLYRCGLKTASDRSWLNFREDIINVYTK